MARWPGEMAVMRQNAVTPTVREQQRRGGESGPCDPAAHSRNQPAYLSCKAALTCSSATHVTLGTSLTPRGRRTSERGLVLWIT